MTPVKAAATIAKMYPERADFSFVITPVSCIKDIVIPIFGNNASAINCCYTLLHSPRYISGIVSNS